MSESEAPSRPWWRHPRLVAHRGGGALAPENTLSALRLAGRLGFRGVEFDVKLSRDAVAVLIHDDLLERTTDGRGAVAATALATLAATDAGARFGPAFAGEHIPTLEAAAELCLALDLWVNIEIKPCPGRDAETGTIVGQEAACRWAAAATPPLLSSFSRVALAAARVAAPELTRSLLVEDVPADWLQALSELDCTALHVHHQRISASLVATAHDAGYGVLCYTVNDPDRATSLFRLGVDCIVTDRLDLFDPRGEHY